MNNSAGQLGPHTSLVTTILVVDVLAVGAAGIVYGLTMNLATTFAEFGPIQTLKAGHLLVSGVAGYLIYTRFWRLPQAGQRADAPGSFFWILSGAGLVWLGIDEYVQTTGRPGAVLGGGRGMCRVGAGGVDRDNVRRGIEYLLDAPRDNGKWKEEYFNAVGFPRIFYLRYHGYSAYFPLWTLARYRTLTADDAERPAFGM